MPPLNTSGAMKRGVPTAIVPCLDSPELARDAEVDEHDAAVGHDEVLRLDVAMDDVLLVDVVQRLARLAAPFHESSTGKPGVPSAASRSCRLSPSMSSMTM